MPAKGQEEIEKVREINYKSTAATIKLLGRVNETKYAWLSFFETQHL